MADAIQRGIEAAQQDLVKESEEKLLEEVINQTMWLFSPLGQILTFTYYYNNVGK